MSQNIQEDEVVHIGLLMTDDMYPTPSGTKVVESFGHRKVPDIDENGAVLDGAPVAEGYHMVLEMPAKELCPWLMSLGHPFWLWNDDADEFRPTLLKTLEDNNAE